MARSYSSPETTPNAADSLGSRPLPLPILPPNTQEQDTLTNESEYNYDHYLVLRSFLNQKQRRRRKVLDDILIADFYIEDRLEPINPSAYDALVNEPGSENIYAVFLEKVDDRQWKCMFGDAEYPCISGPFPRLDWAIDHVRGHLGHRPFRCLGLCDQGASW
jgi:hypothetical protein